MDELMVSNELKVFVQAIQELVDLDEDMLDDEVMKLTMEQMNQILTPSAIKQTVNQIVSNLELQGTTREEALRALDAMKQLINELIYGEKVYTGNKKVLIDTVVKSTFDIFDQAAERYHNFAIDLPMTVDTAGGAKVPTYAHETDAAADLYAMENVTLMPHSLGNKIRTGVKIQLPECWQALILPRSSIGAKTPLRLSNSVGLIDSGYRGELGVLYDNIGDEEYTINAGDRIAQLLVMPSYRFQAKVVDILADSDRGETGFGDSGK